MTVSARVLASPFPSHQSLNDQDDEQDDIPGFLKRAASAQASKPIAASGKSAANLVLLAFASGYCLAYLFRSLPALISEALIKELHLTPGNLGVLSAAFFLTTGALQLPIGVWLDRCGPRRVQGTLMFATVIGAALFAWTDNIVLLTIARALIGVGAAGGFMAGLKAIALWYPRDRVAVANSWLVMLGSLGACLATWPAARVMAEIGWRGLFVLLAGLMAASALAILMLVPESPHSEILPNQHQASPFSRSIAMPHSGVWRHCRRSRLDRPGLSKACGPRPGSEPSRVLVRTRSSPIFW